MHPRPVEQGISVGIVCRVVSDGEESPDGPSIVAVIQVKDLEVLGLDKNRSSGEKSIGGATWAREVERT